jgi:hypothetical protein
MAMAKARLSHPPHPLYNRIKGPLPSSASGGTAYQPLLQAIGRLTFSGQWGTPPLKALPGKLWAGSALVLSNVRMNRNN